MKMLAGKALNRNRTLLFSIIYTVIGIITLSFFSFKGSSTYTYLESSELYTGNVEFMQVYDANMEIEQEIVMPYSLLKQIGFLVWNNERDNNSNWQVNVKEEATGRNVYQWFFNASQLENNTYFMLDTNNPVKVQKDGKYIITIRTDQVSPLTSIAFGIENSNNKQLGNLSVAGKDYPGNLCVRITGGDADSWWSTFYLVLVTIIFFLAYFFHWRAKFSMDVIHNGFFQALVLALIVFFMYLLFLYCPAFTDEKDNIRGGLIIAKGGVLYRDYVTQHMPLGYYLCAVFALLGAGSVTQFRILYYLLISLVWAVLYVRHNEYFGKKIMFFIPCMQIVIPTILFSGSAYQILADGIQSICLTALLFEFIRYFDDHKLDVIRIIIISICIWGSFGSTFISAFPLFVLVIAFVLSEIYLAIRERNSVRFYVNRYLTLFSALVIPPVFITIYFYSTHALKRFYLMAYKFNVDVYPHYMKYGGGKKIQPFFDGISHFFSVISTGFQQCIIQSEMDISLFICRMLITIIFLLVIIRLSIDKQTFLALIIFLYAVMNMTRGSYDFHSLPFWTIAVMIIIIYYSRVFPVKGVTSKVVLVLLICILSKPYFISAASMFLTEKSKDVVTDTEKRVVELTEDGEGIFIDSSSIDSIYLLYKNRYPINRLTYLLPWYLDWFEQDTIDDLNTYQPELVCYNSESSASIWGYQSANAFYYILQNDYERLSQEPRTSGFEIWIRK